MRLRAVQVSSQANPMVIDGALYDGDQLLAAGYCALLPDDQPAIGSIVVGSKPAGLLKYETLTLRLANGDRLRIVPRHVEHAAGQPPALAFDVIP